MLPYTLLPFWCAVSLAAAQRWAPVGEDFSLVYDKVGPGDNGMLVAFGGRLGDTVQNGTWRATLLEGLPLRPWDIHKEDIKGPPARYGHSAVQFGGDCAGQDSMIVFGGVGADGALLDDAWLLDTCALGGWRHLETSGRPPARSHHVASGWGNGRAWEMYVAGGVGAPGPLADAWVLSVDMSSMRGAWRQVASPPAVLGAGAAYTRMPGLNCTFVFSSDRLWRVDAQWTELTSAPGARPEKRRDPALAWLINQTTRELGIVLFGGEAVAGRALGDAWIYGPLSLVSGATSQPAAWNRMPEGPAPRHRHRAVPDAYGLRIVMGGGLGIAGEVMRDSWIFDSSTGAWGELIPLETLVS